MGNPRSELVGIVLMASKGTRIAHDENTPHTHVKEHNLHTTDELQYRAKSHREDAAKNKVPNSAQKAQIKLKCYASEVYFSENLMYQKQPFASAIPENYENQSILLEIITALYSTKNSIIVLGIDIPYITKQSIKNLINNRNQDLLTTTYYHSETSTWEPMLSIWEYETLPCLQTFFDQGGRSVQLFLNTFGNQRVAVIDKQEFQIVNTEASHSNTVNNSKTQL